MENLGTHLRVQIIQVVYCCLYVALMYRILDSLSSRNGFVILLRLKVGLRREPSSRVGVSSHGEVVENQGVNVT